MSRQAQWRREVVSKSFCFLSKVSGMIPQVPQPPQPLSLNDLLRQHCRDRLYVQPLHWTTQHLELLRCRFVRRRCASLPVSSTYSCLTPPRESKQDKEDSKHTQGTDLQEAVRRLAYSKEVIVKLWGLTALLKTLSNDHVVSSQDDLDLYFAGRPVAMLPSHIFSYVIEDVRTPFLAYIDNYEIASFRKDSIPIPQCNLPAWRIRETTLAQLQPTNIEQDPYFVGVLIALAQARQHASLDNVYLLITNRNKPGFVRLYTATITAAFLRKLDQPSVFSDRSLVIQCAHIPSSYLKHEIAAIMESPREKKRLRNSSLIMGQGPSKRNTKLGDRWGGEETT